MEEEKYWNDSEGHLGRMIFPKNVEYISDKIGEEYQNWEAREIIFITAPTGSGKSYFMLHIFLKYLIQKGGKMLYLVNRKILKEQLEEELEEVQDEFYKVAGWSDVNVKAHIDIVT